MSNEMSMFSNAEFGSVKKAGNGTTVTQLKWYPTVLDIIA